MEFPILVLVLCYVEMDAVSVFSSSPLGIETIVLMKHY